MTTQCEETVQMIEKRGMSTRMLKALACGWVVLGSLAAQAAEFSVGRVDIEFAEEGWKEIPLPDMAQAYGGDKSGALAVEAKLYVGGPSDGEGQILVLVSANSEGMGGGRGGYMTYSPDCRSDAQNYREGNEGFRASFSQCLMVTPLYSSESVFKALAPQVMGLQTSVAVAEQRPVYTVWNRHAISTGSFVDVRVFVMAPMGVDHVAEEEGLPKGVPPAHVAWGRLLKDAVKSSVYSLSGRLVIPSIRMAPSTSSPASSGS